MSLHSSTAPAYAINSHLEAVNNDLIELELKYSSYLEQEELHSAVQCLRTWIESYQKGDNEAVQYLSEHGSALLENIKTKFKTAAREIQRIDEESPVGGNFSGGKYDRLNKAAETVIHAEDELAKAFNTEPTPSNPIITK